MDNQYRDRIGQIRTLMTAHGLDLYYIPMDDCHNSEYVGPHFKTIEFASGFTGSAAKVVITKEEAFLWTDGRYFLQASMELEGSGIRLMKMGEEGVPKVEAFLKERLSNGEVLGFDGKMVNTAFAEKLEGKIVYDLDLAGEIWTDRPAQVFTEIKDFSAYAGESVSSKLSRLRRQLKEKTEKEYVHILNSLDDIAWLFNIRANDVEFNPVAYAYAAITEDSVRLYTGNGAVSSEVKDALAEVPVEFGDYRALQAHVLLPAEETAGGKHPVILLDPERISYDMYKSFCDHGYEVTDISNPTSRMKAVKNETEIRNTKIAQLKDGAALVKFMKWIKEQAGNLPVSECDVSDKLLALRSEQEGFLEPSFATIAGYASNAAIIHYEPERGKDAQIGAKGMLLVDSGGHYLEGTTDTTRTFVLGEITEEEKKCFTLVAASMLRLLHFDERKAKTEFNGLECDKLARELLQKYGYNYNHGTGHGIGHVLNVHENPPVISGSRAAELAAEPFVPGMITSDEPGVYVDGSFGVRTENDMLVVEKEDEQGSYLAFENLTFVPIDIDGIAPEYLDAEDLGLLNRYNEQIYEALKDRLDEETAGWLRTYTLPVE